MNTLQVYVHIGSLSLDNGAVTPIRTFFSFVEATGVDEQLGNHYGDDTFLVNESEWPTVEALLIGTKLLYRLSHEPNWKNIQPGSAFDVQTKNSHWRK